MAYAAIFALQMVAGAVLGWVVGRRMAGHRCTWIAIAAVALIALSTVLRGRPELEASLFGPNYLFVANWHASLAPLLCSMAIARASSSRQRVVTSVLAGAAIGCMVYVEPLLLRRPVQLRGSRMDRHGVWIQSSDASCGPAAAATFASALGVSTSETEMTDLCLARRPIGVTPLGLYRGIRTKLKGTAWRCRMANLSFAEFVSGLSEVGDEAIASRAHISELTDGRPILFFARLGENDSSDLRSSWNLGTRHIAVLLGVDQTGRAVVADPAFGVETWPMDHLEVLFDGLTVIPERSPRDDASPK